jgi:hypothetical protein
LPRRQGFDEVDAEDAQLHPEDDEKRARFSVKREVVVEAPRQPLIQLAVSSFTGASSGVVQSLDWFAELLRVDDDGDVADEFFRQERSDVRGALLRVAVAARARAGTWTRVVGGWPQAET